MNEIVVQFETGQELQFQTGITLADVAATIKPLSAPILAAEVDFVLSDLSTPLTKDCRVKWHDVTTEVGSKVYERSLALIMLAAAAVVFPGKQLTIEHSVAGGVYCELKLGRDVTSADIDRLQQTMQVIVNADHPFIRTRFAREQAVALFDQLLEPEKIRLLQQQQQPEVIVHTCNGFIDYVHGVTAPSTGCINVFELKLYPPGLLLRLPDKVSPHCLAPLVQQPQLTGVFREAEQWGEILECAYVANLNDHISQGTITDIVRIAEALHEKKIAQIADFISLNRQQTRVILIAGPSSSGKTTFAQRLGVQLRVNGVKPVPISLDDYFVDRDQTPRDDKGDPDYESLQALDLALFNQHLLALLQGDAVETPIFNFYSGKREASGRLLQVAPDQPLIIEGIHGLNDALTQAIPAANKVKIYISALTQLSIDSHNRIPTTDARLIRRLVRDSQFRGHDALTTLKIWPAVRRGEERNIFPFQEAADVMFNSALIYELAALKKYAEPLLAAVPQGVPEQAEALRLLAFLNYFYSMADQQIPLNSILREFIGHK